MQNRLFLVIILTISLAAGLWLSVSLNGPKPINALYYTPAKQLADFDLIDHNNQTFSKQQLQGHWSFIFTGYTFCPDICPTTMAKLNQHYSEISASSDEDVQVILVSVDPKRDTPARLNEYINYFNDEFIGISAEHKQLFPFVRSLGLMYSMSDDSATENYLVDHSASIVLTNPNGDIQAIFKPEHIVGEIPTVNFEDMLEDFKTIIKRS